MKKAVLLIALFLIALFAPPASPEEPGRSGAVNPLKHEMWLLDAAYKGLIDAVVLKNQSSIPALFRDLERARAKTEKAIKRGELNLPKNPDKMSLFVQMDEEFHANLEALIEASKKGEMPRVEKLTHALLDGCIKCHGMFRR